MTARKKRLADDVTEPPRPPCSTCGEPATHQVTVEIKPLVLDRAPGVHSRPFWTTSYSAVGTRIEAALCTDCKKASVHITVSASAKLEKASRSIL